MLRSGARRWQEYRGQCLAGLAHEIFLKLLNAKREVPGAAERQKTLAAQDGKRALRGCGLTAGTCELDHVAPVRRAFAGSAQTLQALCGDCHSKKTLRESVQPTSLESRVAPGMTPLSPSTSRCAPAAALQAAPQAVAVRLPHTHTVQQHAAPLFLGPEPRGSAPVPELAGELQFRAVTPELASAQLWPAGARH